MKAIQIGLFELASNISNHEVEIFEEPLFYSFVTKDFLEKIRLNPDNDFPEIDYENKEEKEEKEVKKEEKEEKEVKKEEKEEKEDKEVK